MPQGTTVQYVAIPTDGGAYLAHYGRARRMAVFGIRDRQVSSREDWLIPRSRTPGSGSPPRHAGPGAWLPGGHRGAHRPAHGYLAGPDGRAGAGRSD